jgi:hypothetical protein
MTEQQINSLIDWLIIFGFFGAAAVITILIVIVVSLVAYIRTGVHVKDWFEEKFPN